MPDHSRRVLRDAELRTDHLSWGYAATGPHNLATVMLADILANHRECPDCFGASPLTADMIRCGSCSNTGQRPGTKEAEERVLDTVIEKLPDSFERTRPGQAGQGGHGRDGRPADPLVSRADLRRGRDEVGRTAHLVPLTCRDSYRAERSTR